MFKRKIEASPRSRRFFLPILDTRTLELARLFAAEEELAEKIKNDGLTVDKDTIYQVVALARKIARAGFTTNLVDLDEFQDIAQIFSADDPHAARVFQEILMKKNRQSISRDPDVRLAAAHSLFNKQLRIPKKPDEAKAARLLFKLIANLKDQNNSAWTARVAAVLAYLSAAYYPISPPAI